MANRLLWSATAMLVLGSGLSAQAPVGVWTRASPALEPPLRSEAHLVYDPVRARCLLVGGNAPGGQAISDVWEYDGSTWRAFPGAVPPPEPVRYVFSPLRGRIVALAGDRANGPTPMQLYEWDGSVFRPIASNAPPSRAERFQIAWDESRQVLVMFGGGPYGADTWEWDGTTWMQRGTGGPPGRYRHHMTYDTARQVVVVFGGVLAFQLMLLSDTWEWDGAVWRERFGIAPPGVEGLNSGFAHDRTRGRSVLYGGTDRQTGSPSDAVWEYDGTWTRLTTVGGPGRIESMSLAYDSQRSRLVSFGGFQGVNGFGTWEMEVRTGVVGMFAPHGPGCPGPAGVPTLTARSVSRPVLGQTFELRFGRLQSSPLALVFGGIAFDDRFWNGQALPLSLGTYGLPGCALNIAVQHTVVLSNIGGIADWDIPVPMRPALTGQAFFLQGAVLAPGFNPAGAVMTDSGRGIVGSL